MITVDYKLSSRQCDCLHRQLCSLCNLKSGEVCTMPEGFYCEEHDLAFMDIKAIAEGEDDVLLPG